MRAIARVFCAALLAASCSGDGDGGGGVTEPPGSGTLEGRVSGPGGGVPDARVTLSGGGSTETNRDGDFSFSGLEPGQFTVSVQPPSDFRLATGEEASKSATVASGGTASVNWGVVLIDTQARTVEVALNASSFSSADVTIPVGSTVNWVNQTAITHTISPDDPDQTGVWEDVTISGEGTEFDHTFGSTGTFDYVCKLHAGMTGVVRVH